MKKLRDCKYNTVLGAKGKCVLLVSDMQNAYTKGMLDKSFNQDKEIKIIRKMVDLAHKKNISVIYTIISFNEYEILHPNIWLQKIPLIKKLKEGTEYVKLDKRLPFDKKKDLLLVKKHASAFFGTSLVNQLYSENIETIILTGCTTSGCIRAAAVEGIENGFRMMVVKDAVNDRWKESHDIALYDMNAKYADVIDSKKAMDLMKK